MRSCWLKATCSAAAVCCLSLSQDLIVFEPVVMSRLVILRYVKANSQSNGSFIKTANVKISATPSWLQNHSLNGFRWNLENITMSWVWPRMQNHLALWQLGWSAWTWDLSRFGCLGDFCFYFILGLVWKSTDFEMQYVTCHVSTQGTACWGSWWDCLPFMGHIPKTLIFGVWIGIFKPNS